MKKDGENLDFAEDEVVSFVDCVDEKIDEGCLRIADNAYYVEVLKSANRLIHFAKKNDDSRMILQEGSPTDNDVTLHMLFIDGADVHSTDELTKNLPCATEIKMYHVDERKVAVDIVYRNVFSK